MSKLKRRVVYSYSVWFFLFLRILLLFAPQKSYVSAREFEHMETFAARIFNYELNLKRNGNDEVPYEGMLSNVVVDYLFYGWSYHLLWIFNQFVQLIFQASIVTPVSLLLVPRIAICALSFLIDLSLYKICLLGGEKYQSKVLILASSYCMMVYTSRTIVNTKEALLFALLMYFVAECIIDSSNSLKRTDSIMKRFSNTSNKDSKKMMKRKLHMDNVYKNFVPISVVTVLGFFNRPTFLLFAATPIVFWVYRGCSAKSYYGGCKIFKIVTRSLAVCTVILAIALALIVLDSIFYGYTTLEEIFSLNIFSCNLLVIPANQLGAMFARDKPGTELNWIWQLWSFFGKMFSLFHILGVYTYFGFINFVQRCMSKKVLPSPLTSVQYFMNMSCLMAIVLFTLVLKPTTLDLLPLLMPFAYLSADQIKSPQSQAKLDEGLKPTKKTTTTNFIVKLWIGINVVLALYYGFMHQGGVIPATLHISREHRANPIDYHIATSHIPPMPQMFFMQGEHAQEVFIREYGKLPLEKMIEQIISLRYEAYVSGNEYKLYLLMPAYKHTELICSLRDFTRVRLELATYFSPHFTYEALPTFVTAIDTVKTMTDEVLNYQFSNVSGWLNSALLTFHLNLYRIDS